VANFIGETDFIAGTVSGVEGGHILVDTPIGLFKGIPGDPSRIPAAGAHVTVSIRPECWKLGAETRSVNCVEGRIGEAIYLGEIAQYGFEPSKGGEALKIYELNPRFVGRSTEKALCACADVDDVVILVD
jgi:iron(III) transport system ATP-binding protein